MAESIKDHAKRGEDEEPEEGEQIELFPMGSLAGDGLTLKQIIKGNHAQQITVRLNGGEIPAPEGGLLDPETEVTLLVTAEVGRYESVPVRSTDDTAKVKGWKTRQVLRPVYVERAEGSIEALERRFMLLCESDPGEAGALLDRLGGQLRMALE